jgi:hypothetical protein
MAAQLVDWVVRAYRQSQVMGLAEGWPAALAAPLKRGIDERHQQVTELLVADVAEGRTGAARGTAEIIRRRDWTENVIWILSGACKILAERFRERVDATLDGALPEGLAELPNPESLTLWKCAMPIQGVTAGQYVDDDTFEVINRRLAHRPEEREVVTRELRAAQLGRPADCLRPWAECQTVLNKFPLDWPSRLEECGRLGIDIEGNCQL